MELYTFFNSAVVGFGVSLIFCIFFYCVSIEIGNLFVSVALPCA